MKLDILYNVDQLGFLEESKLSKLVVWVGLQSATQKILACTKVAVS